MLAVIRAEENNTRVIKENQAERGTISKLAFTFNSNGFSYNVNSK